MVIGMSTPALTPLTVIAWERWKMPGAALSSTPKSKASGVVSLPPPPPQAASSTAAMAVASRRSEERRVGKEGRSRGAPGRKKKKGWNSADTNHATPSRRDHVPDNARNDNA